MSMARKPTIEERLAMVEASINLHMFFDEALLAVLDEIQGKLKTLMPQTVEGEVSQALTDLELVRQMVAEQRGAAKQQELEMLRSVDMGLIRRMNKERMGR
jgi:hypothetical protein